jgi:hypothetical protein
MMVLVMNFRGFETTSILELAQKPAPATGLFAYNRVKPVAGLDSS